MTAPLPTDAVNLLYTSPPGPKEGTEEHAVLSDHHGFSYAPFSESSCMYTSLADLILVTQLSPCRSSVLLPLQCITNP
jgi:hypothetical protein